MPADSRTLAGMSNLERLIYRLSRMVAVYRAIREPLFAMSRAALEIVRSLRK
jgi:hypothetical protein